MPTSRPHPVRVRGRPPLVVVAVLLALVSLARPAGAVGVPVDPVPVGVWPLQPTPQVVRAFDPPGSPWGAGHRGVDLLGAVGEQVHAALAGRVVFASRLAGRGVVVVDHGPTRTTYEPVVATVRVGDVVARGQPIGSLALASSHCFPRACLHWGWLRGETYLDPLLLVGGEPIVLLPLWRSASGATASVPPLPYAALVSSLRARSATRSRLRGSVRGPALSPPPVWRRPLAMRPLLM
jgi:murein DD-endopeptidase MepM/ murein hydrolase activator NlpD